MQLIDALALVCPTHYGAVERVWKLQAPTLETWERMDSKIEQILQEPHDYCREVETTFNLVHSLAS